MAQLNDRCHLLFYGRNVGAHLGGHQHGVSIQYGLYKFR